MDVINPKMKQRIKLERELLRDILLNKTSNENEFDLLFGNNIFLRIVVDNSYPFKPPTNIYILFNNDNKEYDFFNFVEENYNLYDKDSLEQIKILKDTIYIDKMNWKPNMTIRYIFNKLNNFAL